VLRPGHFAVCPTGYESRCETAAGCDTVILAVPKEALAYAFAERAQPRTGLVSRLSGKDRQLSGLARRLVLEAVQSRSMTAYSVSRLQEQLFELLLERYARSREGVQPGGFTPQVLARINRYIRKHLSEPIDVHDVAGMVGQSRSHFSRVFRQSVGLSPHQYIVLVRLECAVRHMRSAELSLAEIASATGFFDQSHLTHWTRRVYGTSPGQIAKASRHAKPDEPRTIPRRFGG
jgi:AraC family transcriptional regulator